jgi:hypothetical protein
MRKGFLLPLVWLMASGPRSGGFAATNFNGSDCVILTRTEVDNVGSFIRRGRGLLRIEVEGPEACARLNLPEERLRCLRILEVARSMINSAYEQNSKKVVCL